MVKKILWNMFCEQKIFTEHIGFQLCDFIRIKSFQQKKLLKYKLGKFKVQNFYKYIPFMLQNVLASLNSKILKLVLHLCLKLKIQKYIVNVFFIKT